MNNLDDILKLMNAMAGLPFESMEVTSDGVTVRVCRSAAPAVAPAVAVAQQPVPAAASAVPAPAPAQEQQEGKPTAVTSPIIGVFYPAPSPDDAPFVRVGDRVSTGQTLCIVEAMKLMNEIPSPIAGTVVKVLAADGSEVEVGQPLFLIDAEG